MNSDNNLLLNLQRFTIASCNGHTFSSYDTITYEGFVISYITTA